MNKLVSVIVPCRNGMPYLSDALRCVSQQVYSPYEVIVVDDGSTDGTAAILAGWLIGASTSDYQISVETIPQNAPHSTLGALRVGFKKAKGELFTWMAADDCHRPEAIGTLAGVIKDLELGFVCSSKQYHMNELGAVTRLSHQPDAHNPKHLIEHYGCGISFMWTRKLWDIINPKLTGSIIEDYQIAVLAAAYGKYRCIDDCLAYHRDHARSLTVMMGGEARQEAIRIRELARTLLV